MSRQTAAAKEIFLKLKNKAKQFRQHVNIVKTKMLSQTGSGGFHRLYLGGNVEKTGSEEPKIQKRSPWLAENSLLYCRHIRTRDMHREAKMKTIIQDHY